MADAGSLSFAAALLMGGMSRRMQRDKAMLLVNGEPLWKVQLTKLRALQPRRLLLSCRADQDVSEAGQEIERLDDPVLDLGPVDAIRRCLDHVQMPLLVLAVDMPQMTSTFLRDMLQTAIVEKRGVIYHGEHGYDPLCAIYPPVALPLLHKHRRLQDFSTEAVNAGLLKKLVLTPEAETYFLNVNTPADLSCLPLPPSPSPD